jgi:hypothetical protein
MSTRNVVLTVRQDEELCGFVWQFFGDFCLAEFFLELFLADEDTAPIRFIYPTLR